MATERAAALRVPADGAGADWLPDAPPYPPSWVDRLMRRIDALPGPTWGAYLGLIVLGFVLAAAEGWVAGFAQFPAIDPVQTSYGIYFVMPLVVLHYLTGVAGRAWDGFRPATDLDEVGARRIRHGLTVTPRTPALVLLVLGYLVIGVWYVADPVGTGTANVSAPYVAMRFVIEGFITGVFFVLVYQIVRQLRIVGRLHRAATHVDLFQPQALHAMSRLTARTAIILIVLAVFVDIPYPGTPTQAFIATTLLFSLPMLLVAVAAFSLPLRGLHERLAAEKARLQGDASERLEAAIAAMQRAVDREVANETDMEATRAAQVRIDALSKAQASLIEQRRFIGGLSTWPWDPGTLRAVVSAIALPIGLWLLTRLLGYYV